MIRKRLENTSIEIKGKKVPVKIYNEMRYNVRASIGKKAVILRFPLLLPNSEREKQLSNFYAWVQDQFEKHENLGARFFGKEYREIDELNVGNRKYLIKIEATENRSHSAKLNAGVIQLKLAKGASELNLTKSTKLLLSRVVAQDFLPEISRRVNELNQLYFKNEIKNIRLKYNQSNWGSCSSKGNINLSTRLLFAPQDVIDYVIIHELAHFLEMNHSTRFWKIIAEAMPDYKAKELWLKKNGHLCNF
jgi:predicted metal-dependent hydrolase